MQILSRFFLLSTLFLCLSPYRAEKGATDGEQTSTENSGGSGGMSVARAATQLASIAVGATVGGLIAYKFFFTNTGNNNDEVKLLIRQDTFLGDKLKSMLAVACAFTATLSFYIFLGICKIGQNKSVLVKLLVGTLAFAVASIVMPLASLYITTLKAENSTKKLSFWLTTMIGGGLSQTLLSWSVYKVTDHLLLN